MPDATQKKILEALLFALQPVIKALLQAGIGYREFNSLAKTAFVRVATREFGLRGRPTNISRVTAMTGISRKDVKRIREQEADRETERVYETPPTADILAHWHTDAAYRNADGTPRDLAYDGTASSFTALVRAHGGDLTPGAVRTELKRINAIRELPDGRLRVEKLYFLPDDIDEKLITSFETGLYPLAATIAHNCNPLRRDDTRRQVYISFDGIDPEHFPAIRLELKEELDKLSTELHNLIARYDAQDFKSESATRSQVGYGIYYFETPSLPDP